MADTSPASAVDTWGKVEISFMEKRLLISEEGSDRATAYHMSTKLAGCGDDLWFTWQANPAT